MSPSSPLMGGPLCIWQLNMVVQKLPSYGWDHTKILQRLSALLRVDQDKRLWIWGARNGQTDVVKLLLDERAGDHRRLHTC